MLSLVGKDLRAIALYLCVKVPVLGLLVFGALLAGKVFLVLSCVMAAILVTVAPALEWSVGADPFVHSLPVSRRTVVKARYVTSVLLAAGCLAMAAGMAVVFAQTHATHGDVWPGWVALETALTAVIDVSVFISIFLGCVFRFGVPAGGAVSTMTMAVLAPVGIRYVGPEVLARLISTTGAVGAVASVLPVTALVIWVSMRISMRCHERREF